MRVRTAGASVYRARRRAGASLEFAHASTHCITGTRNAAENSLHASHEIQQRHIARSGGDALVYLYDGDLPARYFPEI